MAQIPIVFNEILNVSENTAKSHAYRPLFNVPFLTFCIPHHPQISNPPISAPLENVKFGQCSMESEKFITVCETGQQQIAIIDMSAGNSVTRQKMNAEAAIMNPLSKVIALRCKLHMHVFFILPHLIFLLLCIFSYCSWTNFADFQS